MHTPLLLNYPTETCRAHEYGDPKSLRPKDVQEQYTVDNNTDYDTLPIV